MLAYYLTLAFHSLRRTPWLSALMMLAIALGIGASLTMLMVLRNLSGDPLPGRSAHLYHPQLDPRPADLEAASPEPPDDLTLREARAILDLHAAPRQVMTSANWLPGRRADGQHPLEMIRSRATTAAIFGMFGMRFVQGRPWTATEDDAHAPVVVITRSLNQSLFGGGDSVGQSLELGTRIFRVVGVIDDWNPQPRFYDLNSGSYRKAEQVYLPFSSWLDLPQDYGYGPMRCWGRDHGAGEHHPDTEDCSWVQFWVQLDTAADVERYQAMLTAYSDQQHQAGRFQRTPNVRLRGLLEWLDYKRVIPPTVRMQSWIAFGVLLICLVNAVGLLLSRFMRKAGEIGVRRALGASRAAVFSQCLTEAALIGVFGGLLGIPLTWIGLWMVRQQPVAYADYVQPDPMLLVLAPLLALASALAAGGWPAWRAARIAPALQVKSL